MSASERRKGAQAEREVAAIFRSFGWDTKRTHDGREQAGRGDISGGPEGYHFEIKRHEKLNVPKALDQVQKDCPAGINGVLIHRPSRHVWMATMELDLFLSLLARQQ